MKFTHVMLTSLIFIAALVSVFQWIGLFPVRPAYFGSEMLTFGEDGGINGVFQNSSGSSKFFALGLLYIIFNNQENKRIRGLIGIVSKVLPGLALYLSFTRTGWLMFLAPICLHFIFSKLTRKRLKNLVGAFFIVLFILQFVDFDIVAERIWSYKEANSYSSFDKYNDITSGRLGLYKATMDYLFSANWLDLLVGCGPVSLLDEIEILIGTRTYPHSKILELIATVGVIGSYVYFKMLRNILKNIPVKVSLRTPLIIAILISIFPSHGLGSYGGLILGVIVYCVGDSNMQQKSVNYTFN